MLEAICGVCVGVAAVFLGQWLVAKARADRDEIDPYMLPNDALACYDSNSVNLTDVARSIGVIGGAVKSL